MEAAQTMDDLDNFLGLGGRIRAAPALERFQLFLQIGGMNLAGLDYLEGREPILGVPANSQSFPGLIEIILELGHLKSRPYLDQKRSGSGMFWVFDCPIEV